MQLPGAIRERFKPSLTRWFDLARKDVDDAILSRIAAADYGYGADEILPQLQAIHRTSVIPAAMPFAAQEVLELIRWSSPERKKLSHADEHAFESKAHRAKNFACALLLLAENHGVIELVESRYDTLAIGFRSADFLSDQMREAVAEFALSCLKEEERHSGSYLYAICVLMAACRSRTIAETDLQSIGEWVLDVNRHAVDRNVDDESAEEIPLRFFGFGEWKPIRAELIERAKRIDDERTRESVQGCARLLSRKGR
jgi:hypothetical protein